MILNNNNNIIIIIIWIDCNKVIKVNYILIFFFKLINKTIHKLNPYYSIYNNNNKVIKKNKNNKNYIYLILKLLKL